MYRVLAVIVMATFVIACSTRDRAADTARYAKPTKYSAQIPLMPSMGGYDDRIIDASTSEIEFVGNSVSSVEHVRNMVILHAAMIGRERGFGRYTLGEYELRIHCDRAGSVTRIETIAHYGEEDDLDGQIYEVDEVIGRLHSAGQNPHLSYEGRQKAYLANQASCRTQRIVSPDQMRTNAEVEAEERAAASAADSEGASEN